MPEDPAEDEAEAEKAQDAQTAERLQRGQGTSTSAAPETVGDAERVRHASATGEPEHFEGEASPTQEKLAELGRTGHVQPEEAKEESAERGAKKQERE